MTLKEMTEGTNEVCALIKGITEKKTRSNKPYVTLTLADKSGEINANFWNNTKESVGVSVGELVLAELEAAPYNGAMSYTVKRLQNAAGVEDVDISDFVASAPVSPAKIFKRCMDEVDNMNDKEIAALVRTIYENNKEKLLRHSAAKTIHHNVIGGLLWHVYRMVEVAKSPCAIYENIDKDVVMAGVLLHDIGKIKELDTDPMGVTTYTNAGMLFGHVFMGAEMVRDCGIMLGMPAHKIDAITHIILSHHGKKEWGAVVEPATSEAYMVHAIDVLDSKMYVYEKVTKDLEPETYSDRQYGLEGVSVYRFPENHGAE